MADQLKKASSQDKGHLALYRKYRSQSFDTVIGQPQIVGSLKSAIVNDRLSHAYLFTGPRGVGKTTLARLLARAANCTAEDRSARPCGKCANCKVEIGSHLDLIEIDAASNRGIDDARALREKITSAPSMGSYKVYIIDEVHMLTTEAFNALLKTLEEPPSHAIFILATTEAHKLPETIVSRTQRYRFRPITHGDLVAHLKDISAKESINISDEALELVASSGRGSFRDAIGALDQASSSGLEQIDAEAIRDLLGQGDPKIMAEVISAVDNKNPAAVLKALDDAWAGGVQPAQLARQLSEAWRQRLREATASGDAAALDSSTRALEALVPVLKSPWPELALEATLVKLSSTVFIPKTQMTSQPAPNEDRTPAPTPSAAKKPEPVRQPSAGGAPDADLWMKVLTQIKQRNNSLYALLRSSTTVSFDGDDVILGCRFSFHRDRLKESKNLQVIEQALARVYGRKLRVQVQLETKPQAATVAASDPAAELMSSALEILGGEVVND